MSVFALVALLFSAVECHRGRLHGQPNQQRRTAREEFIRNDTNMVTLDGGEFYMGINDRGGRNGEAPRYKNGVKPFKMDIYLVTNADWREFSKAKPNFTTDAATRGWSSVFVGHINRTTRRLHQHHDPEQKYPDMIPLRGAKWTQPYGSGSNLTGKWNHPVVHISKRDAVHYCFWAGKRLPTEYEWEFAARGGIKYAEYPWGDTYKVGMTNLYQGTYPINDTARDGFAGTSPVGNYEPQNSYGLHDMIGNVWEWTSTPYHFRHILQDKNHFVLKGASYIDSRKGDVNLTARTAARMGRIFWYAASNIGFRCAKPAPMPKNKKMKKIDLSRSVQIPVVRHSEL